ncbi:hypothetical protein FQN55_000948 [Onygenales sp. PD_40]|nr:hypothetical protein FQN55_000948 [Onygenales sp. PD_40]KAK2782201.1 hypothetical protein FQN52_001039 [Onygenales sp. PD_12]
MVDEPDADESAEGTSYTGEYHHAPSAPRRTQPNDPPPIHPPHDGEADGFGHTNSFFDHFDPMLDADPFGLTASMHFQTPFSYTQNHARQ